jgi:membrane protease YdiL (CAAX protease family)
MTRGLVVALLARVVIFAIMPLALPPFLGLAVLAAAQLAILWLGLFRPRVTSPREQGWRSPDALDVVLGVAGGAACVGLAALVFRVDGLAEELLARPAEEHALWLGVGLLAAFVEETLYRGWLQPRFVEKWGPVVGVLATAVVFSLLHFQPAPRPILVKIGFGVILGLLRQRKGTLWAAGITHTIIWVVFGMA